MKGWGICKLHSRTDLNNSAHASSAETRLTRWLKSTTATPSTSGTSLFGPCLPLDFAARPGLGAAERPSPPLELVNEENEEEDGTEKREDEAGAAGEDHGSMGGSSEEVKSRSS